MLEFPSNNTIPSMEFSIVRMKGRACASLLIKFQWKVSMTSNALGIMAIHYGL